MKSNELKVKSFNEEEELAPVHNFTVQNWLDNYKLSPGILPKNIPTGYKKVSLSHNKINLEKFTVTPPTTPEPTTPEPTTPEPTTPEPTTPEPTTPEPTTNLNVDPKIYEDYTKKLLEQATKSVNNIPVLAANHSHQDNHTVDSTTKISSDGDGVNIDGGNFNSSGSTASFSSAEVDSKVESNLDPTHDDHGCCLSCGFKWCPGESKCIRVQNYSEDICSKAEAETEAETESEAESETEIISKNKNNFPLGEILLVVFLVLLICGFLYFSITSAKKPQESSFSF